VTAIPLMTINAIAVSKRIVRIIKECFLLIRQYQA
jgi:hypothetical protein